MCGIVKLYSVRGRKPLKGGVDVRFAGIAIYPREGTKTHERTDPKSDCRSHCNLSPRGDENHDQPCWPHRDAGVAISPRKGTETCGNPPKPPGNRLQLIPARGRKPVSVIVVRRKTRLQFLPARGQKKHLCHWRLPAAEVLCFFLSYILFYRSGAVPAGIVFVTGSALTPCGTSGFMGRISCR